MSVVRLVHNKFIMCMDEERDIVATNMISLPSTSGLGFCTHKKQDPRPPPCRLHVLSVNNIQSLGENAGVAIHRASSEVWAFTLVESKNQQLSSRGGPES